MAREFMCQYGNCNETTIVVRFNDLDFKERAGFCCREHAGLFMLRRAFQLDAQRKNEARDRIVEAVQRDLQH